METATRSSSGWRQPTATGGWRPTAGTGSILASERTGFPVRWNNWHRSQDDATELRMGASLKNINTTIFGCLMAVLLIICLQASSAAGTWSVISVPQPPGAVVYPMAVTLDAAGNLYVADQSNGGRIQERNIEGNW